jgi:hypothetical protein
VTLPIEVPLALSRELMIPAVMADPLGLIYGLPLTVQVTVSAGGEQVVTRKRVLVNVRLSDDHQANQNPLVTGLAYRRNKEDQLIPYDAARIPEVRLGERLRIQPSHLDKESYPTRIGDRHTGCVEIQRSTEALRFAFFASTGSFAPNSTNTEPPVFREEGNDPHRLESVYEAPKELLPGESNLVRVWIVTRDERAGSSFFEFPLRLVP